MTPDEKTKAVNDLDAARKKAAKIVKTDPVGALYWLLDGFVGYGIATNRNG